MAFEILESNLSIVMYFSGIITGFYLSSDEGRDDVDEVDFEFVANDKSRVQTNYFTGG